MIEDNKSASLSVCRVPCPLSTYRILYSLLTTFSSLEEHPAGVEPALPPWQGSRLPLQHGCSCPDRIVKERVQRGPEGLEPSPAWLRARYAAANTLIP
jgi:hypothetical protein